MGILRSRGSAPAGNGRVRARLPFGEGIGSPRRDLCSTPFIAPPPEPGTKPAEILPQPQLPYLWPELGAQLATAPPPLLPIGVALSSTSRLAILAPPGGGKSTLLAYLALRYSEDPELVPLYAHLAELSLGPESPGASEPPVEGPLIRAIQRRAGTLTADALPGLLQQALDDGRAVVLLDGWDELALSERSDYTTWIELLLARFPGGKYIVAAPSMGYGPFPEMGFVPLCLAPWQPEQAADLLERWAKALDTAVPTVADSPRVGCTKGAGPELLEAGSNPSRGNAGHHDDSQRPNPLGEAGQAVQRSGPVASGARR